MSIDEIERIDASFSFDIKVDDDHKKIILSVKIIININVRCSQRDGMLHGFCCWFETLTSISYIYIYINSTRC